MYFFIEIIIKLKTTFKIIKIFNFDNRLKIKYGRHRILEANSKFPFKIIN